MSDQTTEEFTQLMAIMLSRTSPHVPISQSLCDDLYSGAFDNFYLANLSDEIRLRIEAAAPASCPQA